MDQPDGPDAEDRELVEKLAKLQSMHQQITDLRGLLPERLLRPTQMALENPRNVSPERLSASMKKAAIDGSNDIQRFKKSFWSLEMRELWQKASDADIPQGRDSWTVDYQTLVKGSTFNDEVPNLTTNGARANDATMTEDENAIIEQYQIPESPIKVEKSGSQTIYPLLVNIDGLVVLVTQKEADGKKVLVVEGKPGRDATDLEKDIVRNANKHSSTGLARLLSILASYHDYQFQLCSQCKNIFDDDMKYPLARHLKTTPSTDKNKFEWEILHENFTQRGTNIACIFVEPE